MCLESREAARRRRLQLPALRALSPLQDSASDSDSAEPRLSLQLPRHSRPEIFTFDVESVQPPPRRPLRRGHSGAKVKRPRRVLYPAKVRRYLPPPETDRPLRCLYLLCLLVFVQVCCEEPEEGPATAVLPAATAVLPASPTGVLPASPTGVLPASAAPSGVLSAPSGVLPASAASPKGLLPASAVGPFANHSQHLLQGHMPPGWLCHQR